MKIQNACIKTSSIYMKDNQLTCKLILETENIQPIVVYISDTNHQLSQTLTNLFEITDTDAYEQLVGTNVRIILENESVTSIGNIIYNRWLNLQTNKTYFL